MINNFSWRLTELEDMLFWEREVYIKLLNDYNQEMKMKKQQQEQQGFLY